MNGSGWARCNDCKILCFALLALARGGARASHFLFLTPSKIRGNHQAVPWGEFGMLTSGGHKSGHILVELIMPSNVLLVLTYRDDYLYTIFLLFGNETGN
jgi:hypothetical protein